MPWGIKVIVRLKVIFVTLLLCLTSVIIVTIDDINVTAIGGCGDSNPLDLEFIHSITENLSNVIYDAYDDGELSKGRAFGSKGEHYAANYIYNTMDEIGLSNVETMLNAWYEFEVSLT